MCATYSITYRCGHEDHVADFSHWCTTPCDVVNRVDANFFGFCTYCLLNIDNLSHYRPDDVAVEDEVFAHSQRILDMAVAEDTKEITVHSGGEGALNGNTIKYNPMEPRELVLDGLLDEADIEHLGCLIEGINANLWCKLLNEHTLAPDRDQMRLYIQLRTMWLNQLLRRRASTMCVDEAAELTRRLNKVASPAPELEHEECMICFEKYGQKTENRPCEAPVRLPCGHVYGETCLKEWVISNRRRREEIQTFSICTLCRDGFGIVRNFELEHGLSNGSEVTIEDPWWFDWLRIFDS